MKFFYTLPLVACLLLAASGNLLAQGCVAVRNMTINATPGGTSVLQQPGQWQVYAGYRHLHSHRHFVGTEEQTQRAEAGTEVINESHSVDLGFSYAVNGRLSVSLVLPVSYTDRSSLYEHLGNASGLRGNTQSMGLGDVRLSASYWVLDPLTHRKGNLALGLGIKAPTGNSNVRDDFTKKDAAGNLYLLNKAVDQSIQLGDGGWGVTVEFQGYQKLLGRLYGYANGFYMFNPKEMNNTPSGSTFMSVPDQFLARGGFNALLLPRQGISVSLGGRVEGVPSHDLIGGKEGFRRPGYIVSYEPGLSYNTPHNTLSFTAPVAVIRNRTASVSDLRNGSHGDAAFADYFITATFAHRF